MIGERPYRMTAEKTAHGLKRCTRNALVQVAIRLDPDTFEQIRDAAIKQGSSFASMARVLIEWGLESKEAL